MFTRTAGSVAPLVLLTANAFAGTPTVTFELIPQAVSANDISPDGRWIVGGLDLNGDFLSDVGYLHDSTTGLTSQLIGPALEATAVSDNGQAVVGCIPDPIDGPLGEVAGIWRPVVGWQSIGFLPNAGTCPSRSNAYEISANGSIVVGLSWDGCSGRGFRWSQATGMVELEPLANGSNRASAVSGDGMLVAGFAQGSGSRTPAYWNGAGAGFLLDPPNGDALGEIRGIADDGTVMLGEWATTELTSRASKWTLTETGWEREQVATGSLFAGWAGTAMDVADDGTVIGFDRILGNRRAWIQPQGTGPIMDLKTWVEANGGDVPNDLTLEVCQAITSNGRTIIGHGVGAAWRIDITYPCTTDLTGDGSTGFADLNQMLAAWGPCVGCPEDLDGDGNVGFTDLNTLLAVWGACP